MASPQPVQQSAPLPDIAGIISGAVIEGLKTAGIFSDAPTASSQENSNQAASVQGSVAAVIQDITGEQNLPTVNQNNSYVTTPNISVVCDPLVGAIDRPELVHKPMAVPLASRISDKFSPTFGPTNMLILGHCYNGPTQTIRSTILLFRRRHPPIGRS